MTSIYHNYQLHSKKGEAIVYILGNYAWEVCGAAVMHNKSLCKISEVSLSNYCPSVMLHCSATAYITVSPASQP